MELGTLLLAELLIFLGLQACACHHAWLKKDSLNKKSNKRFFFFSFVAFFIVVAFCFVLKQDVSV